MLEMYKGVANSPETTITNNISESDTLIYVLDETRVPEELPNLMVLGTGVSAETIKVISIDGNALTVARGFQGVPRSWNAGTVIARNFTEYDYNALKENIETLKENVDTNADDIVDLQDDLAAHKAENVHQQEVHGLKIEKGTWTPVLVGSTVAGTHTYSQQVGRYTKIDNLVYISMRLTITSIDSNASGDLNIAGLPFISISQGTGLSISSLTNIKITEEFKFVFARTLPNTSRIELVRVRAATALPSIVSISDAEANPNVEIRISGVYETN